MKSCGTVIKIIVVFFFALVVSGKVAYCVPAAGNIAEVIQPDGVTKISVRLLGDEWYHWHETVDGYTVMLDERDGWWKYCELDEVGNLVPSKYRVGIDDPVKVGIQKGIKAKKEAVKSIRLRRFEGRGIPAESKEPNSVELELSSKTEGPVSKVVAPPRGTIKNLVILCRFADHDTTKYFPALAYDSLFNVIGYNYDGAVGSVKDYYLETSYGQMTLISTIAANTWFSLPRNEVFYGGNDAYGNDSNPRQMVYDALSAADPYIDFSQFDQDGDGYVDCITFIHSGHGEEYTGNPSSCIWSHKWALSSPYVTGEGVRVSHYHTEPACRGLYTTKYITRIGVICHELGHFFGLPDLYDTDGGVGEGAGAWCIMASGSWGYNGSSEPERPTHFSAWCKTQLGWLSPTKLHTKSVHQIPRVETTPFAGKVSEGLPTTEYFLVENRQRYGFDLNLLGGTNGGGLCIWHIDDAKRNNNTPYNYKVALEEADGNLSLQKTPTSRAQAGDPYPGSSNNTTFNPFSNPSTYSNPIGGGTNSYISFLNISVSTATMTFNLQTLVPTLYDPIDPPDSANYTISWSSSVNATKYMLAEGILTTLNSYTDGAENDTTFREEWTRIGDFRRTSENASSGSYSYLARFCDDPLPSGGWTLWNSDFQILTLNTPFYVTASTNVTFKTRFFLYSATDPWQRAYLQIRRASENTWNNLTTFAGGPHTAWQSVTISSTLFAPYVNQNCYLRFAVINLAGPVYSYTTNTPYWPWNGFAFDEFAINNAQFTSYSWTTVSDNITSTSTTFTDKPIGTYAYKVSAYANGIWQPWSNIEDVSVTVPIELSHFIAIPGDEKRNVR